MTEERAGRRTIAHKTLESMIALGIFLTTAICIVLMNGLTKHSMQTHTREMFASANSIAAIVDGDKVLEYAKTGEKDQEYNRVTDYMRSVYENTPLIFDFYVYVPDEDGFTYVWDMDAANPEDTHLGERDTYLAGEKEVVERLLSGGESEVFYSKDRVHGFLMPALAVVYNKEGKGVAIAGADFDVRDVRRGVNSFLQIISLVSLLVVSGGVFVYYRFNADTMVRPIELLTQGVKEMVSDLEAGKKLEFDIHTGDEIEDLAVAFEEMYNETQGYMDRVTLMTAEQERVDTELSLAARIQMDMLPRDFTGFPEIDNLDIYAAMEPAKEVGGDFYDFFLIDENHLALVIADVSGKGIPACLFMMMTKIMISNSAELGLSPKEIIRRTNDRICANNEEGMFVTVWLGILDLASGLVTAVNAGHEFPVIRRPEGEFEEYEDPHDFVVGGVADMEYEEYTFTLERGSSLFVYTDGVVEATNAGEELFGEERMIRALNEVPNAGAKELAVHVRESVDAFVGDAPQFDDMTMLALRYL